MTDEPVDSEPSLAEPAGGPPEGRLADEPVGVEPTDLDEPAEAKPAAGGGIHSWGRGYEGFIAILALVVAVLALGVGAWALKDARSKSSTKTPAKTTTTTTTTPAGGAKIATPNVVGNNGTAASVKVTNNKLKPKIVRVKSASVPKGNVISQDPAPATEVPSGSVVTLTISDGP